MPSLSDSLNPDLSGYTPADSPGPVIPARPGGTPSSDLQAILSPFQRCPLPPFWQSSPDALRQFYRGSSTPQTRIFNTPSL